MSTKPTSSMKRRLNGVVALVVVAFTVYIMVNLIDAAIINSNEYQSYANAQQFTSVSIDAMRGSIYDANGEVLAKSGTVYNIYLDPVTLEKNDPDKKDLIFDTLAEILEIDRSFIVERSQKETGYEILKREVDEVIKDEIVAFIDANNITSIGAEATLKRFYPNNELAAAVIGFTGFEGNGEYGLEAQYDEYLSGVDGKVIMARDAQGGQMPYRYEQAFEAQDGNSLVLNIDLTIQHYLESELSETVDEHNPNERATGIIMNANTGEILAMASVPGYDLNNYSTIYDTETRLLLEELDKTTDEYATERAIAWETQWKNKAISELYFPGSVFKVITGAAALEEKSVSLTDTFSCYGSHSVADTTFRCWNDKVHGEQTFVEAMTNSCNPAFIQIGEELGYEKFVDYFVSFGLAEKTGIDLPGEASSINMSTYPANSVTLASSSFGQTNKVTPIEMITAYAAVINGGYLVTPYVVDRIVDSNGNVVEQFEPTIKRQVISEETSEIMRSTLETVVVENGGSNAYIQGFSIGGKSGTSQKLDIAGGSEVYVSSYCAFAPADDPEIIMLVMVDEPSNGDYFGSKVAAPVVRNVFEEVLPYLGHFPEYTEEEYENMAVILPSVEEENVTAAQNTLTALDLNVEVVGDGDTVVRQVPEGNQSMPRYGNVILYTTNESKTVFAVPDVTGMTLSEANTAITNAGFNFMATGGAANYSGAIAVSQSYLGGQVEKGTVIQVEFMSNDETG